MILFHPPCHPETGNPPAHVFHVALCGLADFGDGTYEWSGTIDYGDDMAPVRDAEGRVTCVDAAGNAWQAVMTETCGPVDPLTPEE